MSTFRVCSQMGLVVGSGVPVVSILVFSFLASPELVFRAAKGLGVAPFLQRGRPEAPCSVTVMVSPPETDRWPWASWFGDILRVSEAWGAQGFHRLCAQEPWQSEGLCCAVSFTPAVFFLAETSGS